jgi:hypothetical protein
MNAQSNIHPSAWGPRYGISYAWRIIGYVFESVYACTCRSFLFSAPRIYMKIWGCLWDTVSVLPLLWYLYGITLIFFYFISILPHKYSQLQAWKLCTIIYDPNNRLLVPSRASPVYRLPTLVVSFSFSLIFFFFCLRRPILFLLYLMCLILLFGLHPVTWCCELWVFSFTNTIGVFHRFFSKDGSWTSTGYFLKTGLVHLWLVQ